MPANLILTGFSGTGKSSVGRRLAERLAWRFVDLDAQIAAAAGKPVPAIFAEEGEPAFRRREGEALRAALAAEYAVVATGGGVVVAAENRALMLERGFVVCLEARPATIHARLLTHQAQDEEAALRPLLAGEDPLARIATLKAARQALYADCHATVHTDALDEEAVAEEVHRALARAGLAHSPGEGDGPVSIRTATGFYQVHVGSGTLDALGQAVTRFRPRARAFLVSDGNVFTRHGLRALASLAEAGLEARHAVVPAGEGSKTLAQAEALYEWLIRQGAERGDVIVALGGGVIGDLAGFVAATYLRGLPYVQVPTTLLAMVDSSVGGKTAVDHPLGKNLIGAFHPPALVVADVATLASLPERERRSGWAEVVKHAMILDPDLFARLEAQVGALRHLDPALMPAVVRRNVWLKATVVAEDEREGGRRMILNYGHSVGHALEALSDYGLLHGEAVALGMVVAARLAVKSGLLPHEVARRQRNLLAALGLPVSPPPWLQFSASDVLRAMARDKKMERGALRWVLPVRVGEARVVRDLPQEMVRGALEETL